MVSKRTKCVKRTRPQSEEWTKNGRRSIQVSKKKKKNWIKTTNFFFSRRKGRMYEK